MIMALYEIQWVIEPAWRAGLADHLHAGDGSVRRAHDSRPIRAHGARYISRRSGLPAIATIASRASPLLRLRVTHSDSHSAIKQELAEPDPTRLAYRELIKQTLRDVVMQPNTDALSVIKAAVAAKVSAVDRDNVRALIVDELRRLHEGVLARYGLRPLKFMAWKAGQKHGDPTWFAQ